MPRIMLIGEWRSGKSTLISVLSRSDYTPRKVFAVDYHGDFVNTPSEFLENRRWYPALITASAHCDILLFVQDATRTTCQIAPALAAMFNRRVIGVVTKTDLPQANIARAERFLKNAGVRETYAVSLASGAGLDELRAVLGLS
ncbi:MAG: ethanolamine utilization protein EutP [Mailhella sp.]|nr:ethanolamine utilization protein EutP [Mailhella sp.]